MGGDFSVHFSTAFPLERSAYLSTNTQPIYTNLSNQLSQIIDTFRGAKEANKFKTRLSTRLVRTVACRGFLSAVRPDRFFLYTTAYQPPSFKTCLLPQPRADQGLVGTDEYLIVST